MKKFLRIALCSALLLLVFAVAGTTSAEAASRLKLNKTNKVTVKAKAKNTYKIKISQYSTLKITTTASYRNRMDITIKVIDSKGNNVITDSGKWTAQSENSDMNDLLMETLIAPGTYTVTFENSSSSDKWSNNVKLTCKPFTLLKNSKKTTVSLDKGGTKIYRIVSKKDGHFFITTGSKSSYDIDFYLLDRNGEQLDDDDTNPDWSFDETTGKKSMHWHTVDIKAGTYYLRIENKTNIKQKIKVGVYTKTERD